MNAPADFVPSFAVYASETDHKVANHLHSLGSIQAAVQMAEKFGMRSYYVRRSIWTVMGERPRGMVVHTKR